MSDYEIRDVSNRKKHPEIVADIFIVPSVYGPADLRPDPTIFVRVRNVSEVIALHVAVVIRLPQRLGEFNWHPDNSWHAVVDGMHCLQFRVRNPSNAPVFPGDELIISHKMDRLDPIPYNDDGPEITDIRLAVFADEMPKVEIRKEVADALKKWSESDVITIDRGVVVGIG